MSTAVCSSEPELWLLEVGMAQLRRENGQNCEVSTQLGRGRGLELAIWTRCKQYFVLKTSNNS
jgi:hypothetical protein